MQFANKCLENDDLLSLNGVIDIARVSSILEFTDTRNEKWRHCYLANSGSFSDEHDVYKNRKKCRHG